MSHSCFSGEAKTSSVKIVGVFSVSDGVDDSTDSECSAVKRGVADADDD